MQAFVLHCPGTGSVGPQPEAEERGARAADLSRKYVQSYPDADKVQAEKIR